MFQEIVVELPESIVVVAAFKFIVNGGGGNTTTFTDEVAEPPLFVHDAVKFVFVLRIPEDF